MKKLYIVKPSEQAMTIFMCNDGADLNEKGEFFFKEEFWDLKHLPLEVKEIENIQDIPIHWREQASLVWGTDEDMTVEGALKFVKSQNDKEYQEYLRLKAKYEAETISKD